VDGSSAKVLHAVAAAAAEWKAAEERGFLEAQRRVAEVAQAEAAMKALLIEEVGFDTS